MGIKNYPFDELIPKPKERNEQGFPKRFTPERLFFKRFFVKTNVLIVRCDVNLIKSN